MWSQSTENMKLLRETALDSNKLQRTLKTKWHGQDDVKWFQKVNTRYDGVDVVEGGWKRGDMFYGLKDNYKVVI